MRKYLISFFSTLLISAAGIATETTLWEGTYTTDGIEINADAISTFVAGDVLRVYLTVPENGGNFKICYKGVANAWTETALPSVNGQWPWVSGGNETYEITLSRADLDSIAGMNIYLYEGTCTITRVTLITTSAGTNQSIWSGEKDFGAAWGEWETLPASLFSTAEAGQLLRFRFRDLRAGAQLKVGRSDWEVMDDTEIMGLSGRYQDFAITTTMLTELQANGAIISGLGFTLTEVLLLNPASLKTLNLSVPVTDNWVFSARPSITIHAGNPYNEALAAAVEVEITTDQMVPVTTLTTSVEVAANDSQTITLTTGTDLAPGFYKATCTVGDDLARAFVFGINPTAIVSAPDMQPDFETFWSAAKSELANIPMNATLTEISAKSTSARKVYLVELQSVPDTLGGSPVVIRGYYCEPQDGKAHPVIMHYAGYDSGYRPGGQDVKPYCPSGDAEPDYAEFFLSTRGQNINNRLAGEREPDGKGDFINTYGDWFAFHFGDKDSYYYRGAFMDCVQAIRFMATRPTSDMTNLFAEGQSQGGAFTYAAAALSDYPFRAIAPAIAFMGDYPDYFNIVNWPAYVARENQGPMTDAELFAFLSYFDTKNLATMVSCPVIACIGLQDDVCPPHTNIAPYNNLLSTDKQLLFNAELMHQAANDWYTRYMSFFTARLTDPATALDKVPDTYTNAYKVLENGHLVIICNNTKYNANGTMVQ